ncbi:lysylphosphatidylglycerol synthase transmembrane domain-containing protein [candidate division KSB1 bacterium]
MKSFYYLKIFLSVFFLYYVIFYIDMDRIIDTFGQADIRFLLLSFILLIPNIFLQWYKWHYLIKIPLKTVARMITLRTFLISMYFGLLTPGKLGEYGRAFLLPYNPKSALLGFTVLDKAYNYIVIFISGIIAVYYIFSGYLDEHRIVNSVFAVFVALVAFLIIYCVINPGKVYLKLKTLNDNYFNKEYISNFIFCLDRVTLSMNLKMLLLSGLFVFIYIMQFYFLVLAFGSVEFLPGFESLNLVIFINTFIPLFFGNLGLREGAAVYLLSRFGVESGAAFNAGLILFIINLLIPAVIGYIVFLKQKNPAV